MMDDAEGFCGHPVPASVGHNGGPPLTPYETVRDRVEDLHGECKLWLDGAKVETQEHADGIANLLAMLRAATKDTDSARKVEAEPFDLGKAEVQARYKPILTKAEQAEKACKAALAPWLKKKADEVEAEARSAREEAERKKRAAEEAMRASDATNLSAREAADALLKDAKKAATVASKAERQTATAGGFAGKAAGLRTTYKPKIEDAVVALRWAWGAYPEEMKGCALTLAVREVAAGKLEIPGFAIEKVTSVV